MNKVQSGSYQRIVDTPAIVNSLLLITVSASVAISLAYWVGSGWQETSLSLFILAGFSLVLMLVHKQGYSIAAALVLYLVVSNIMVFNISIGQAIFDEAMLVFPLLIIFSGLIFGKRAVILVTGITLTQLILIFILSLSDHVQPFEGAVELRFVDTFTTLIILGATGILVWVIVDIIEKAVEKILLSETDLEQAYDHTLQAWAKALELRGREGQGHGSRVAALSTLLAERMELQPQTVRNIRQGALLHDIGKMGIPEEILLKESAFDIQEKKVLNQHPLLGAEIVADIEYLQGAQEIISNHHERYNGQGYPTGLQGEQIPLGAQIFAIVDCWDALRTNRSCRPAWTDQQVLAYIKSQAGEKFSPKIVQAFLEMIDEFGLGTAE